MQMIGRMENLHPLAHDEYLWKTNIYRESVNHNALSLYTRIAERFKQHTVVMFNNFPVRDLKITNVCELNID